MLTCNRLNITLEITTDLLPFKPPLSKQVDKHIPSVGEVGIAELVDNVASGHVFGQLNRGTALSQTRGQYSNHSLLKVPLPPQKTADNVLSLLIMTTRQKTADNNVETSIQPE